MDATHLSDTTFASLGLNEALLSALHNAGYEHCTPIQAQSLPHLLEGKDIAGQAKTGTGKTIAFLVAVIQHLISTPASDQRRPTQIRALILAPTRELAIQIHKDAEALTQNTELKLGLVYGGANYDKQRKTLEQGVDIVIGTPGRIIDYFKQKVFDLRAVQAMVLDEADRMFDLGFIKDIRFLLRRMPHPEKRLNMLFSATLSHRVMELAYEHMNNPTLVKIESETVTADKIEQCVYYAANDEKIPLLLGLMQQLTPERAIIFVNTKRAAETVWGFLEGNDYKAGLLSGDIPQKKRQHLLERFQEGELPILVATDVAARGLHIPAISHVFNFDLPQNAEDYVHRIGRTARAGASGHAISFACEDYAFYLPEIEQYISDKIESRPVSGDLLVTPKPAVKLKSSKPKHRPTNKSSGNKNASDKPNRKHRPRRGPRKPRESQ